MNEETNPEVTPLDEDSLWEKSDEELEAMAKESKKSIPKEEANLDPDERAELESIKNELEQPEDEQDSNTETNTELNDEEVDETNKDSIEEQPKDKKSTKNKQFKLKPLKAAGKEIPIEDIEELYQLASKGVDYTRKMQQISPFRSAVELMQQQELSVDDLNLLVDIKQGNKEAVKKLIKDVDLDVYEEFDPEDEVQYTPKNYAPNEIEVQLKEIEDKISQDEEYPTTVKVIESVLDPKSKEMLMQNPNLIEGLHQDIKSGIFFEIEPLVTKQMLLGKATGSYIETYANLASQLIEQKKQEALQKAQSNQQQKQMQQTQMQEVKQRAGINKAVKPQRSYADYHINYVDMSDEEFDRLYNEIMNR